MVLLIGLIFLLGYGAAMGAGIGFFVFQPLLPEDSKHSPARWGAIIGVILMTLWIQIAVWT